MEDKIRALALRDGRYSPAAFEFLYESLKDAVRLAGKADSTKDQHVTGQEVLAGMRHLALRLFGPLAAPVWRAWGIKDTLDWGRIVFLLVDNGHLNRQESDTIEDFRQGFDFDEVFVRQYRVRLPDFGGTAEEPG